MLLPVLGQQIFDPAKVKIGPCAHVHTAIASSNAIVEGQPQSCGRNHGVFVKDGTYYVILE